MTNRGVALLTALWAIVLMGGVAAGITTSARIGFRASANRATLTRGYWAAEACLAIASARYATSRLTDTATIDLGRTTTCDWHVSDATARVNVNLVSIETIRTVLTSVGLPRDSVARLIDALQARRPVPVADTADLQLLPGWDQRAVSIVGLDGPGTLNVNGASRMTLTALGFPGEAVDRLADRLAAGRPIVRMDELMREVSPVARAALGRLPRDVADRLIFAPGQFLINATGWVGSVGAFPRAKIEVLAAPVSGRLAVQRRRVS